MVFDADKVVLTRNGDFVGKGYYCHGGFLYLRLVLMISIILVFILFILLSLQIYDMVD